MIFPAPAKTYNTAHPSTVPAANLSQHQKRQRMQPEDPVNVVRLDVSDQSMRIMASLCMEPLFLQKKLVLPEALRPMGSVNALFAATPGRSFLVRMDILLPQRVRFPLRTRIPCRIPDLHNTGYRSPYAPSVSIQYFMQAKEKTVHKTVYCFRKSIVIEWCNRPKSKACTPVR